jgi:hypothetical protein
VVCPARRVCPTPRPLRAHAPTCHPCSELAHCMFWYFWVGGGGGWGPGDSGAALLLVSVFFTSPTPPASTPPAPYDPLAVPATPPPPLNFHISMHARMVGRGVWDWVGGSVGWVGTKVGLPAGSAPSRHLLSLPVAAHGLTRPLPGPAAFCLLLECGV